MECGKKRKVIENNIQYISVFFLFLSVFQTQDPGFRHESQPCVVKNCSLFFPAKKSRMYCMWAVARSPTYLQNNVGSFNIFWIFYESDISDIVETVFPDVSFLICNFNMDQI